MFQFFQTRGGTTVAWLGGALGLGIIVYALLSGQPQPVAEIAAPEVAAKELGEPVQSDAGETTELASAKPTTPSDLNAPQPAPGNEAKPAAEVPPKAVAEESQGVDSAPSEVEAPAPEDTTAPQAQPAVASESEPLPEAKPENQLETAATSEPEAEITPAADPAPATDSATEPTAEVASEPTTEATIEPATEAASEPINKPKRRPSAPATEIAQSTQDTPSPTVAPSTAATTETTQEAAPASEDTPTQNEAAPASAPEADQDVDGKIVVASAPTPSQTAEPAQNLAAETAAQPSATVITPTLPLPNTPPENAPTFDLIRIDSQGSAVFAGRAEPNANIDILANGAVIGTAKVSSSGEFVALVETPESASPQAIELVARAMDGNVVRSTEPVIVLGRLSEPDRPQVAPQDPAADVTVPAIVRAGDNEVELVQAPRALASDQVVLDTITYDADSAVVLVGRGQPGREVRIYANGALQASAKASGDGSWRLLIDDLAAGNYVLRADQIGSDGAVISRFETPFQRQFPTAETLARLQEDESEIVVQPGNNLWTIARNRYGEGVKFTVIFDANKDQIRDPDLIYPGQVFELPTAQ